MYYLLLYRIQSKTVIYIQSVYNFLPHRGRLNTYNLHTLSIQLAYNYISSIYFVRLCTPDIQNIYN